MLVLNKLNRDNCIGSPKVTIFCINNMGILSSYLYLRNKMEKNIKYYLEDPVRLKEISISEINQRLESAPYSQPLRLLAELKAQQIAMSSSNSETAYGVYFAEDYENSGSGNSKKVEQSSVANIAAATAAIGAAASIAKETKIDAIEAPFAEESSVEVRPEPQVVSHSLADDFAEDTLEADILEENPNVELVNEVSHNDADEFLEDEVENELLEVNINEAGSFREIDERPDKIELNIDTEEDAIINEVDHEAESLSKIDQILSRERTSIDTRDGSMSDSQTDELSMTDKVITEELAVDHDIESGSQVDALEDLSNVKEVVGSDVGEDARSLADFKVVAPIVSKLEKSKKVELPFVKVPSPSISKGVKAKIGEVKADAPKLDDIKVAKKKSKKNKGGSSKSKDDKIKSKKSKSNKSKKGLDKKSKSKKKDEKNSKKKDTKKKSKKDQPKAKKEKTRNSKGKKSKSPEVKKVKGEIAVEIGATKVSGGKKPTKSTSRKVKAQKSKEQIKYVLVSDSSSKDMSMKDYDGVSNYTSWLLDQESVNGDQKNEVAVSKKSKSKGKKKKKKKSKVLQVAKDSVKKSDLIISEPLAAILASQGHKKKARKMYEQLSLIFPEKSSYFAGRIEKLKK